MTENTEAPQGGEEHISEVRRMLLDQMRALRTAGGDGLKVEIQRAKAVSEVAQTVINSARVEVDYIVAVKGASESAFLQSPDEDRTPRIPTTPQSPLPAADDPARLGGPADSHPWRGNKTVHRLGRA